jgi:cell division protein FtsZ
MIASQLQGVEFVVANTDGQALAASLSDNKIQLGLDSTQGLGAGANPNVGKMAALEGLDELMEIIENSNMVFITAGMGGGTGSGAAPIIARAVKDLGILTVAVVTTPFEFEGPRRKRTAESGMAEMKAAGIDTMITVPNQNLLAIAEPGSSLADAFQLADQVLLTGVKGITDLVVSPGMVNLDFADVHAVMHQAGQAMMGTGMASGENRAREAAEKALENAVLGELRLTEASGVLVTIGGGNDLTLMEVRRERG